MIDRPGRCQLLQAGISEQQSCYCQSSVLVHCATHTYAHGRAHIQMQMGMDTHISPCADTCVCVHTHTHIDTHTHSFFFLSLFFLCHSLTHTHTHALAITHFLSLCYAPAVKSQLNNESAALLPFCIEAEELVIGCIEKHTVCASLPAAARSAHMGNRLMRPREYPGTPAHLSLD